MNNRNTLSKLLNFFSRNLNTIRSITHDHGDPIDRYAVLARCATSRTCDRTLKSKIRSFWFNWYFEFKLLYVQTEIKFFMT